MYETYRMLAREHEADLEREARKRALATQAPKRVSKWPFAGLRRPTLERLERRHPCAGLR
jgi:hypothetical protein